MKPIEINGKKIGTFCEPFIIAEVGINHNGDIELAKKMILTAKSAGVDAVKFQTFHSEEFIQDKTTTYTYKSQGKIITEPMIDMFKRNEFSINEWKEIKAFCDLNNILFLSTPQNESDLELLKVIGIDAIKVGSDDFVNTPLVRRYANEGLPMLLSCGMATKEEIDKTLKIIQDAGNREVVLLLCTSQYPTPPEDVNISKLVVMKKEYPKVVLGFSDHTQGVEAAIMACAMGARVFEKHFTMSHELPGPDHWFSEEPQELKRWVDSIKTSYKMMGCAELKPTETELEMRKIAHRSITVIKDILCGEKFSEKNIGMRRPGTGLSANCWDQIIGKTARYDLKEGMQLKWEDINE